MRQTSWVEWLVGEGWELKAKIGGGLWWVLRWLVLFWLMLVPSVVFAVVTVWCWHGRGWEKVVVTYTSGNKTVVRTQWGPHLPTKA